MLYTCTNCDAQYPKWQGRCAECGKWGTIAKSKCQNPNVKKTSDRPSTQIEVFNLGEIAADQAQKKLTGISELDRVLGGGIVPGSVILLGGEPGIGKSTLVLQIAARLVLSADKTNLAATPIASPSIYVSGEESLPQIKMRAQRLKLKLEKLKFISTTNAESIGTVLKKQRPKIAIIDSIQTLHLDDIASEPGSVSQVRACGSYLASIAKEFNIALILIGHITKAGSLAGPKTLEHLVDTVLYLELAKNDSYRILRTIKNRFGPTDEIGLFQMGNMGLEELKDVSRFFLTEKLENYSGRIHTVILEGSRPFVIEIQALVAKTYFGYPKRTAIGFDLNRLQLLLAVLSKRAKVNLGAYDVYLNVAGGLKIKEQSADLAVVLAVYSAFKDKTFPIDMIALGEIGLGGEIRPISRIDQRIKQAAALGFKKAIAPPDSKSKTKEQIEIQEAKTLSEAATRLVLPAGKTNLVAA